MLLLLGSWVSVFLLSFVEGLKAVAFFLCEWAINVCGHVFTAPGLPCLLPQTRLPHVSPHISTVTKQSKCSWMTADVSKLWTASGGASCTLPLMPAEAVKSPGRSSTLILLTTEKSQQLKKKPPRWKSSLSVPLLHSVSRSTMKTGCFLQLYNRL